MAPGRVEETFTRARALIRETVEKEGSDVVVLPETWSTGFLPDDPEACADENGEHTRRIFSALAKELQVSIVCGSVITRRAGELFNTAYVFDRSGAVIAQYDQTHLFTPGGEHCCFTPGDRICTFSLEGIPCALIICYDLRFPELTRTCALQGVDVMFVVSQWPAARISHLETLARARAIENQMFLVLCNSAGTAGDVRCGGRSAIIDPWGDYLARAGEGEEVITAAPDLSVIGSIRSSINVFRDRRPDLYRI